MGPLVDEAWLLERLGEPALVVVDCRWQLANPEAGRQACEAGHVPGAAFMDVEQELADPPGAGGRHPLPARERFERAARTAGISSASEVVAYDESGEGGAARLWWLLRHFGHPGAAVLDGGLAAWRDAGGPLRAGAEQPPAGDFEARPGSGDTVTADDIRDGRFALLDARAPERYRGEVEPIDPVAGHIPGAGNLPFADVAPAGRFRAPAETLALFEAAGAPVGSEPVAYCGSGVTACTLVLAAAAAGRDDIRLYPGSWSEWCEISSTR
jgi:thiosulfate/3-mercaptopyruvate sulfurtransferase